MKRILPLLFLALPASAFTPATGGSITVLPNGDYVHVFTQNGTLTLTEGIEDVRVLVVAGGGQGGAHYGAGGGAGGMVETNGVDLASGVYDVTIGAGGTGGDGYRGAKGGDSSFAGGAVSISAAGGGGGGSWEGSGYEHGSDGGSGGGGGRNVGRPGNGIAGQGHAGGSPAADSDGGGGGGAGAVGGNGASGVSGNGGDGLPSDITGTETWYAGGGAGGWSWSNTHTAGTGGRGGGASSGGANGAAAPAGEPNTGGGGSGSCGRSTDGGAGGSGIVVVRYSPPAAPPGQILLSLASATPASDGTATLAYNAIAGSVDLSTLTLHAAWGLAEDRLCWTNDFSAPAASGTATVSGLRPDRVYYARLFTDDGAGGNVSESFVISFRTPADAAGTPGAADPVIASVSLVSHNGSVAAFSGSLSSFGGSAAADCTLRLWHGTTDALSTMAPFAAGAPAADGSFSFTATGLEPAAVNYWFLEVENAAGRIDRTVVSSVTTLGASHLGGPVHSLAGSVLRMRDGIDVFGAGGETTVWLWIGTNGCEMAEYGKQVFTAQGIPDFTVDFGAYGVDVRYAFVCSNACPGYVWVEYSVTNSVATEDNNTYIWNGGSEGDWEDAANWRLASGSDPLAAYPSSSLSGARIEGAGGAVTVRVSQAHSCALRLQDAAVPVTLVGVAEGAAIDASGFADGRIRGGLVLTGPISVSLPGRVQIDEGKSVAVLDGASFATGGELHMRPYSSLVVDAATLVNNGAFTVAENVEVLVDHGGRFLRTSRADADQGELTTPPSTVTVRNGSLFQANRFLIAKENRLVVEDSTVTSDLHFLMSMIFNSGYASGIVEFSGAAPSFVHADGRMSLWQRVSPGPRWIFHVPHEGWTNAPVRVNSFGENENASGGSVWSVEVAAGEEDLKELKRVYADREVPLVRMTQGNRISVANVSLGNPPDAGLGDSLYYTYDWTEDAASPSTAGTAPTGIWLHLASRGGPTVIVVR